MYRDERREFTRIPILRDQAKTLLRAGIRQFTVELIDASPHGFAVTCPESLGAARGDVLLLRVTEGWYEVRVVRIEPLEVGRYPIEYDCFLGVERLRWLGYGPDHHWLAAVGVRRASLILAGAVLAGLVVGAVCIATSGPGWQQIQSALGSVANLRR